MLVRWGSYTGRINRLEIERAEARRWTEDARETLRAQKLTGMPGSGKKSDLADVVINIERMERNYSDLLRRLDAEVSELIRTRNRVDDMLKRLPGVQAQVLTMRYIDRKSWKDIGKALTYDESNVRRYERSAVDAIAAMIEGQKKAGA